MKKDKVNVKQLSTERLYELVNNGNTAKKLKKKANEEMLRREKQFNIA